MAGGIIFFFFNPVQTPAQSRVSHEVRQSCIALYPAGSWTSPRRAPVLLLNSSHCGQFVLQVSPYIGTYTQVQLLTFSSLPTTMHCCVNSELIFLMTSLQDHQAVANSPRARLNIPSPPASPHKACAPGHNHLSGLPLTSYEFFNVFLSQRVPKLHAVPQGLHSVFLPSPIPSFFCCYESLQSSGAQPQQICASRCKFQWWWETKLHFQGLFSIIAAQSLKGQRTRSEEHRACAADKRDGAF